MFHANVNNERVLDGDKILKLQKKIKVGNRLYWMLTIPAYINALMAFYFYYIDQNLIALLTPINSIPLFIVAGYFSKQIRKDEKELGEIYNK